MRTQRSSALQAIQGATMGDGPSREITQTAAAGGANGRRALSWGGHKAGGEGEESIRRIDPWGRVEQQAVTVSRLSFAIV
jgi:hypothetical protein